MKMYLSKGTKRFGIREVEVSQVVGKTVILANGGYMSLGKDIHATYEEALECVNKSRNQQAAGLQKRIARLQKQLDRVSTEPTTPPPNPNTVLIDVIGAILVNDRDKLAQIYYTLTTQTGG